MWLGHQGVVGSSSFVNTALYAGDVSTDRDFLIIDDPEDELFYLDHIVDNGFFGLRQEWQHDLSQRHYLRWGFDVRRYDVTYDYELNAEIEDPIDDPRFYPGERLDSFHDAYEGDQYSVFVTDRMRLSDRFTGEVGLR